MRMLLLWSLAAAMVLGAIEPALACSCLGSSLEEERKNASLIFVGLVTDIRLPETAADNGYASVTFAVLQAWQRRSPRSVVVLTAPRGMSCGFIPTVGGYYLIFAQRSSSDRQLHMNLCSYNIALFCGGEILEALGRPATRHEMLPSIDQWGSDDAPIPAWIRCMPRPRAPTHPSLMIPNGVEIKRFSATIFRDGSAHDVDFSLECEKWCEEACTARLKESIQLAIESWCWEPAVYRGVPVAIRVESF